MTRERKGWLMIFVAIIMFSSFLGWLHTTTAKERKQMVHDGLQNQTIVQDTHGRKYSVRKIMYGDKTAICFITKNKMGCVWEDTNE